MQEQWCPSPALYGITSNAGSNNPRTGSSQEPILNTARLLGPYPPPSLPITKKHKKTNYNYKVIPNLSWELLHLHIKSHEKKLRYLRDKKIKY